MSVRSDASRSRPGALSSAEPLPWDQTHHWFTTWVPMEVSAQVSQAAQMRGESISAFLVRALQAELDGLTPRRRQRSLQRPRHHRHK
jgi:hypothetical protein